MAVFIFCSSATPSMPMIFYKNQIEYCSSFQLYSRVFHSRVYLSVLGRRSVKTESNRERNSVLQERHLTDLMAMAMAGNGASWPNTSTRSSPDADADADTLLTQWLPQLVVLRAAKLVALLIAPVRSGLSRSMLRQATATATAFSSLGCTQFCGRYDWWTVQRDC